VQFRARPVVVIETDSQLLKARFIQFVVLVNDLARVNAFAFGAQFLPGLQGA